MFIKGVEAQKYATIILTSVLFIYLIIFMTEKLILADDLNVLSREAINCIKTGVGRRPFPDMGAQQQSIKIFEPTIS